MTNKSAFGVTQIPNLTSPAARLLRQSGTLSKSLAFQESSSGGTVMKFLQDTGSAWLPKILISRSKAEGAEVSLLEFAESGMTYALPMILGPALGTIFHKLLGKPFEKKLLTETYQALKSQNPHIRNRAMAAKSAIILSTIGAIGLWGESLVNYGKNLMTAKVFKKDKFSDVVNLSQGQMQPQSPTVEESPQVKKAKKRMVQATAVFGGILVASGLLAGVGHHFSPLRLLSDKLVRHFDFEFTKTAKNGVEKVTSGLGNRKGLLGAIMMTCSLPYLDSARDNYERLETAIRLPVVFAYILYGQDWIQGFMTQRFPGLFKGALNEKRQVLSMAQIAENAIQQARKTHPGLSEDALLDKAQGAMRQGTIAKGLTIGMPLLSGILVTGLGLGLVNRLLTAYRFKQQQGMQTPVSAPKSLALPTGSNAISPLPFQNAFSSMQTHYYASQPAMGQAPRHFTVTTPQQPIPFTAMGLGGSQQHVG